MCLRVIHRNSHSPKPKLKFGETLTSFSTPTDCQADTIAPLSPFVPVTITFPTILRRIFTRFRAMQMLRMEPFVRWRTIIGQGFKGLEEEQSCQIVVRAR